MKIYLIEEVKGKIRMGTDITENAEIKYGCGFIVLAIMFFHLNCCDRVGLVI